MAMLLVVTYVNPNYELHSSKNFADLCYPVLLPCLTDFSDMNFRNNSCLVRIHIFLCWNLGIHIQYCILQRYQPLKPAFDLFL